MANPITTVVGALLFRWYRLSGWFMMSSVASRSPNTVFAFAPDRFPETPGCYLMFDTSGSLLYVGKAKNLRRRLASYFRRSVRPHRKAEMIDRIARIDIFLVRNEREALVLESNLIRHHKPRYNSRFTRKGDSYYYIALTDEPFPRLVPYRRERANYALQDANGKHAGLFGPYTGWRMRNRLKEALHDMFPLRACHSLPRTPCIRATEGHCAAPCAGSVTQAAYNGMVREAVHVLRSPSKRLLHGIEGQMRASAERGLYEEAGKLRGRLRALEHAALPQAVELNRNLDAEVFWADGSLIAVLSVRNGRTIGVRFESAKSPGLPAPQVPKGMYIIGNRSIGPLLIGWGLSSSRVQVPKNAGSDIGQLLQICRLNHSYESHRTSA